MKKIERRYTTVNLRASSDDEKSRKLKGYAAKFNSRSEDLGGFTEVIKEGAFRKSIESGQPVHALFNHDSSAVLASRDAGTLQISEDKNGLLIEIDVVETTVGNDLLANIRAGNINKMSFGFFIPEGGDDWTESKDGTVLRTLTDVDLFEVSPVTFPAYKATSIETNTRGLDKLMDLKSLKIKGLMLQAQTEAEI